jgi:biopolymer transport protein ExbD
MQLPEEPDSSAQINIVPMIDVIFAVLVFFLLSSLYLTRSPQQLPINLPTAATGETGPTRNTLTLTLPADGGIALNQQAVTLAALPTAIQARRVGNQPLIVVIQADAAVPHGQVVAVMDALRQLEGVQIGIAVTPFAGEPVTP